ncbi:hypothetical protein AVEN_224760-2 [Araneus ventricosus]|uniref:Uncharacterized protein n=1 Tax=Araneus ventricosus TaxID=182803 RepID=A0A4Y2GX76_ARAVE|nr:hypothetical protein AVEN_224760-2 [Araneus ventricosus]
MGNRASQDSDGEFYEGMLEVSDRGLGSYRTVSIRDIFKKPLLTTSESSSTTTEDLTERCPCKCHERREKQDILQTVVENCCRCNRPKITEPADCCSCQCHIAVQKRLKKCCVCRTRINTIYSSSDNRSERAQSEQSVGNSDENPSEQSPPEESRT